MFLRRLICLFVFCITLFIFLSLLTFNAADLSILFDSSSDTDVLGEAHLAVGPLNIFGKLGANVSALLIYYFGCSAFLIVLILTLIGVIIFANLRGASLSFKNNIERFVGLICLLCIMPTIFHIAGFEIFADVYPGGLVGLGLSNCLFSIFEPVHVILFLYCIFLASIILVDQFKVSRYLIYVLYPFKLVPYRAIYKFINKLILSLCKFVGLYTTKFLDYLTLNSNKIDSEIDVNKIFEDPFWTMYFNYEKVSSLHDSELSGLDMKFETADCTQYILPQPDLFDLPDPELDDSKLHKECQDKAKILEQKLERFGIKGKVVSIVYGPVITLFEYQPSIETKISNILALEDDLALALQAVSLRIIAPIPGKSVIGFELAHNARKPVLFSEIINDSGVNFLKYDLPLILGNNTNGDSVLIDLAKMPHLLIAGSTGSGKSVGLNAMLISLLCKKSPQELKLILIDPKKLEFAAYSDIAHLVFPIITESSQALIALRWALKTMNQRYATMSQFGVKNIKEYRNLAQDKRQDKVLPDMPYIVIIIDELADLMMVSGKDVEYSIVRLAQMARASGIHLIIATQRPSVDVITGLIKVNFACRISYKVTSKIDSRTILDTQGAEKLLGQGDMLLRDVSGSITRVHGAYVTDREINCVVEHIRQQQSVQYEQIDQQFNTDSGLPNSEIDELYDNVKNFISDKDEISISLIQRAFRIGYNRSARIIDQLQTDGYILPTNGSKMRKVVKE